MILIDGDLLLHTVSSATEQETDWGNGIHTLHANEEQGKVLLRMRINEYREKFGDPTVVAFTDSVNFRKAIAEDYKGNRRGRKPIAYLTYKAFLEENYKCITVPTLEADDVLGIIATKRKDDDPVIISDDKDFRQIPGRVYSPRSGELRTISVEEGDYYHLQQTLVGDRVDNYPGCPGVGEVKARAVLSGELGPTWDAVKLCYERAGKSEADALQQARLARILRIEDYDYDKREVILWTPSTAASSAE